MIPKLTDEQLEALSHADGLVSVEDGITHRKYFLVEESMLANLRQQSDLLAIREGIGDMESGRVAPLAEVVTRIRNALGLV